MIDAYAVQASFNLIDNVSPALKSMMAGMSGLLAQAKALQSALNGVAAAQIKVNAAAAGMGNAAAQAQRYAASMDAAAASTNAAAAASKGLMASQIPRSVTPPLHGQYIPPAAPYITGRLGRPGSTYDSVASQQARNGIENVRRLGYNGGSLPEISPAASGMAMRGALGGQYIPNAGRSTMAAGSGSTYDSVGRAIPPPRYNPPVAMPGLHDALITGAVGAGILSMIKHPIEEAQKYQTITEKFNQFGMGGKALAEAEKFARTTKVFGTSNAEMLAYVQESQGIFRESGKHTLKEQLEGAKLAAPTMAKVKLASQGLDPHLKQMSEAKIMDMLRATEMAGGLQSPKLFNEHIGGMFKAIQSSGGNVDFTQYRQFFAKAGSSAMGMSPKALYATMEPIIGELKGGAAGDALMTSFNRLNAITRVPNQVAHSLVDMGLWDNKKITWNKMGGIHHTDGNPFTKSKEFTQNPVKFYQDSVRPIYDKLGLSPEEIIRQNSMIFGRTGGKMFNLVDKQSATIKNSEVAFDKARALDPSVKAVAKTYGGGKLAFEASVANFNLATGKTGGLLDLAARAITGLTRGIERMTTFANKHPMLTKMAVTFVATFAALAVLAGGVVLIASAFKSIGTMAKFLISGIARLPAVMAFLASKIPLLVTGIKMLASGFMFAARILMANPIGLILTAVAVAAFILYKNWSSILPKLKQIWSTMKSTAIATWSAIKAGVIAMWNAIKATFTGAYGAVVGIMASIANAIVGGLQRVISAVSSMMGGIGGMVSGMGSRISSMLGMASAQTQKQSYARPNANGSNVQVTNHFDAHGITTMVSKGQAKAMSGPRRGVGGHDGSMGLKMVSQGAY